MHEDSQVTAPVATDIRIEDLPTLRGAEMVLSGSGPIQPKPGTCALRRVT
jgi:hypothetical protein